MLFFPNSGRVYNAVTMHFMDDDKAWEKKFYGNCTKMIRAILNKSWKLHSIKL